MMDQGPAGPVYSPDGKTLMLSGSRLLQLVDLPTGKELGPTTGHMASLTAIWFASNGSQILTKDARLTQTWNATSERIWAHSLQSCPPCRGCQRFSAPMAGSA